MSFLATDCPCGSTKSYEICCAPYHSGEAFPATAEKLMRSRYSAYVTKNVDYLLATWHESSRPKQLDLDREPRKWLGLKIVATEAGSVDDFEGTVEFVARYSVNGRAVRMCEKSRFERIGGRWIYIDGEIK